MKIDLKFVPLCLQILALITSVSCSTIGQSGGQLSESTLSNRNAAPAKLIPTNDSLNSSNPALNPTYISSQADYHYTMGETLSFEGQTARAIEEYKSTLVYDPKSIHVRLRLAAEFVRMGMMTEAVEQAETTVTLAPENIEARMLLGGLYMQLKLYPAAHEQFSAILEKEPGHPEASVYIGALLAEEHKYDESVKYFEQLAKNPKFRETEKAYYYIGRVRSEQGAEHFALANKAYAKALAIKAEYPEATNAYAVLLRTQGQTKEMEQLLRSYQEKFGPEREMARQLSHYYLEHEDFDRALDQLEALDGFERDNLNIKIQIALILIEQKKYQIAAQRLEDVLLLAPDSDKVRYYLGAVYEEINQPALAIEHYGKILPGSTYFAEAVIHSAQLHKNMGQLDKAVAQLEKAIKDQDDVPQLYAFYATLLDEQKQFKKALKMLTAAVEKFPANTQLRFFLGTMDDRLGDMKESVAQMRKVLDIDPNHVQALNYLAYTFAETGDNLDEAVHLAAHALELQPTDGYILDTLGWIHFKRGDTEDAIKYLEAAVKARPDESIIAEHLGDAYLRHQMWQKAQKLYQKAAGLESDKSRQQKLSDKLFSLRNQVQSRLAGFGPLETEREKGFAIFRGGLLPFVIWRRRPRRRSSGLPKLSLKMANPFSRSVPSGTRLDLDKNKFCLDCFRFIDETSFSAYCSSHDQIYSFSCFRSRFCWVCYGASPYSRCA